MVVSNTGTLELSNTILEKCNVGLWAFELDTGSPPRMYVNDTMLNLLGLEQHISPEDTYHAWYDNIDEKHYGEVSKAVEQMTQGSHAEVQYPWHHPNGEIWIVRCGGVRNYNYKNGIRIEGTHQNVTKLAHLEARNLSDMLSTLSDDFLDVYYLDPYTGGFTSYSGRTSVNADAVDFSNLNFYSSVSTDSKNLVHPDDISIIEEKYNKSNLINLLESGGSEEFILRWVDNSHNNIRYMKNKITSYADFDGTKKLVIGVQDVSKSIEYERVKEEQLIIMDALGKDYEFIDIIDLNEDKAKDTSRHFRSPVQRTPLVAAWEADIPYTKKLDAMRDEIVFIPDREAFELHTRREVILKNLQKDRVYYVNFRVVLYDIIHYAQLKYIGITDDYGNIIRFFSAFINADKQMTQQMEIRRQLSSALHNAQAVSQKNQELLKNLSGDIRGALQLIISNDASALGKLHSPDYIKGCLAKNDETCRQALCLVSEILNTERESRFKKISGNYNISLLRGKRILLAEDNSMNMEIATDVLEDYGIVVIPAVDGKIALDLVKAAFIDKKIEPFDLIIMDGQMPVMDGYEATTAIRSLPCDEARRLPIIAMTANAFEEDKQRAYSVGMDAHLTKPIDGKILEKVLISLLC